MPKLSRKREAFIKERAKDPLASNAEIARRAGYPVVSARQRAYKITKDKNFQARLAELGQVGLDALEDVAKNDKNGMARASAGKTLVETAYGKPKSNDEPKGFNGNLTINVLKLGDNDIKGLRSVTPTPVVQDIGSLTPGADVAH